MKITLTGRLLRRFGKEYRITEGDLEVTGYHRSENAAINAFNIAKRIWGT